MTRLRIQLLGPFEIWRDSQLLPSVAWPGRKARQLLKILVTHRERVVATDELIEWLWPGLTPASARNSLWVSVSRLRRLLEPEMAGQGDSTYLLTAEPGYRFDPGNACEIDVDAYLDHVGAGRWHERQGAYAPAIDAYLASEALYHGGYLPEDPYDDWAIPAREGLRETWLETKIALARCHLALGRYAGSLASAREVLGQDPCRETAWRLVMEVHYRSGERDQALLTFERCRAVLARELGVDPLPETIALHERILRAPTYPDSPRPSPPPLPPFLSLHLPFVGREREWAQLNGLLGQALGGRGSIALISGEPGIGKTRLLEELGGLAAARGAHVLAGHCYELEKNIAYAPMVEALRTLLDRSGSAAFPCPAAQLAVVAELLPELREVRPDLPACTPLPADEARTRLLAALSAALRTCAQGLPLVLILDDLQWADPSSLQLIHALARQSRNQSLLLAGAYRSTDVEAPHPLLSLREQLARLGLLHEIALSPFQEGEVALLLRLLVGEGAGPILAQRLFRETGGQPYFLAELLRTLTQEGGLLHSLGGQWHLAAEMEAGLDAAWLLPPSVRATTLGRLDRLPPEDRELLDQASVAGGEFSSALMSRLLDRSEAWVAAQAERLSARGFLRPRPPDRYAFGHELMRRAAYEALSEPRRRWLHRQLAGALQADGSTAGTVASHYTASDRPWLALEPALQAASQAAHLVAYDEALAWCQQALEIAEAHPHAVPAGYRTRLHLQWRSLWYYRGDLERTIAAGQAALSAARREGDASAQLSALWHLAHDETQVAAGALSGLQTEALALARCLGDPVALARSLARLGSDTGFVAPPAERAQALEALDQAVSLARRCGDPALLHQVLCELWGVGRLPVARAALEEALGLVRQLGHRPEEVGTLAKLADLLARQGDFSASVVCARQGLDLARQINSPAYGAWNQRVLGQALVAQSDTVEGLSCLQQAAQTFEAYAWRTMLAGTLLRQGLALQMAGDGDAALAALERVVALSQETHELYESAYALASLGELRCLRGAVQSGGDALEQASALAAQVGLPWHRAGTLVHLASGWLLIDEVGHARAAAEEAVSLAEEEDLRELAAHALWQRGRALYALGDRDGARQSLVTGLERARAIGQIWLERRLVAALQDLRQP